MKPSLVVLDFSGTLSLESVLFTRPESLARELEESGLQRVGVTTVQQFWEEAVNPTWPVGGTTAIGYQRLLFEQVSRIAAQAGVPSDRAEMWLSAGRFVGRYFARSVFDPAWTQLLQGLSARGDVRVAVATDHYAEATSHILQQLQSIGIAASPIQQAGVERGFLVANSADLGHLKASRGFWEPVRAILGEGSVRQVILIDDFGGNEQLLDAYSAQDRVQLRQEKTVEMLDKVFSAPVHTFPFLLPDAGDAAPDVLRQEFRVLVEQAERFVHKALASDPRASSSEPAG